MHWNHNNINKTPVTKYFENGYVSFYKNRNDDKLYYVIWVWIENGYELVAQESGKLKMSTDLRLHDEQLINYSTHNEQHGIYS